MRSLFKVLVGSRAHGLYTETSDHDIRGVYICDTTDWLGLDPPRQHGQGVDTQWEVGHFCRLALSCNPTVLEALAAPTLETTPDGEVLRSMIPLFLSRKMVATSHKGFAESQKRKAQDGTLAPQRVNKFLSHYLRVLYAGIHLLKTGTVLVNVSGTEIEQDCRNAKLGKVPVDYVLDLGTTLEAMLANEEVTSSLPDSPRREEVNKWLIDLRRKEL